MNINKQQIKEWFKKNHPNVIGSYQMANKLEEPMLDIIEQCFNELAPKSKWVSVFEEIASRQIKCEICGCETISLYGGGWDNDRIYCTNKDCGAEYEFPTTTETPK